MTRLTPAERLLISLGISSPKEIDLEAIAWHVGALVKYRHMDNADATIIGSVSHAVIAVNSSSVQLGGIFDCAMNWAIAPPPRTNFILRRERYWQFRWRAARSRTTCRPVCRRFGTAAVSGASLYKQA